MQNRKETLILFLGDIVIFYVSLWVAFTIRYFELPAREFLAPHFVPFSILIAVWLLSFFIAGLYNKHTLFFRRKLPITILKTQVINSALGISFFYLIPYFLITPRANLFIYLFVSFIFILAWRLYGPRVFGARKRNNALLVASGKDAGDIIDEINHNRRYAFTFAYSIDVDKCGAEEIQREVIKLVTQRKVSTVVIDLHSGKIRDAFPSLYDLLFAKVQFIDIQKVYEQVFNRVPLTLIDYGWFLRNVSSSTHWMYSFVRRVLDSCVAVFLGIFSLLLYPFVYLAIKLDDGGPLFIRQERVGEFGRRIYIVKFRTMRENDYGKWVVKNDPRITRAGNILRVSRIDELPQLWNIVRGDLALIGPRPELPHLVELYEKEIPYYNVRHLVKPGLTGWGQIHHERPPHSLEATKEKLSYDLYYLKNRSFLLDIEIILKTIKTMLSRSGV